jgi:CheY-like chemotaxis protein
MTDTVLVADDSRTIRQIVEMALKASSWEVVGVGSAQDAIQAARQNPQVILLDYYMPDGSGYDVCRALKSDAQTSGIPIVMLGGTYKNFDEALARQAGADDVLMKPFKTDALLEAISSAQKNGATAAPPQPTTPEPEPEPVYRTPQPEPEPEPEPEPVYKAPEPEPEPVYGAPEPEPEPVYKAPERKPAQKTPLPRPRTQAQRQQQPTPMPSKPSQPRIPSEPARSVSKPDITTGSTPGTPMPSGSGAGAGAGAGAAGVSRSEIEAMIKEEVKAAVRAELPALLRNVMGEIFQQKVLPKLMQHAEARVKKVVTESLSGQIQKMVRVELERLLED